MEETLKNYQPVSAMDLESADASLKDGFSDEGEGQLTIDVYQNAEEIIVESPIAGVSPEDLDISVTSDSVTIRGKRQREHSVHKKDYLYQECYWGAFSRSVILPQEVDADKADASMKNGVLRIKIPKLNKQRNQKVKVKLD